MERIVKINNLVNEESGDGRQGKENGQNDGGDEKLFFETAFSVPSGSAGLGSAKRGAQTPLALLQQNRANQ